MDSNESTLHDKPNGASRSIGSKVAQEKKHAERLSNCLWTGNYVHTWTGNYVRTFGKPSYPAYARCGRNFADCAQVAILVCGDKTFVGGSDEGSAVDIARIRARSGGYDPMNAAFANYITKPAEGELTTKSRADPRHGVRPFGDLLT